MKNPVLEDRAVSLSSNHFKFESAKDAVLGGRRMSNHNEILRKGFSEKLRKNIDLENFPETASYIQDLIYHIEKEKRKLKNLKPIHGRFVG